MSAWTEFTPAVVLNALPTDLHTLYLSWLDANPSKTNRLAELIAETLATYRQAAACNVDVVLDEDETTVPTTGFRHALNTVTFNLGMEMGVEFAPEVATLITRADIWLRMVQNGSISPVDFTAGTPSYRVPKCFTQRIRMLWG